MRIDAWDNEHAYLIVDSLIIKDKIYYSGGTQICGRLNSDYLDTIDANFTHNSTTMFINITNNINQNSFSKSFGIKSLFILIDYVKFS